MVWIGRNSASGMSRHSAWQSAGGKNMSEDIGRTKVLALIRLNAARKSPPVWRLTSPRCHFHAMHSRSFGSITQKYAYMKLIMKSSIEEKPNALCRFSWKNSVLQPITAHILECRNRPSRTSAEDA